MSGAGANPAGFAGFDENFGLARQVYDLVRDRGARAVLRRVTVSGGSQRLPSPPILEDPALDGACVADGATVSLRAAVARGVIQVGDTLTVDGQSYVATAIVPSRPDTADTPGFDAIPVLPHTAAHADGAPVSLRWSADQPCFVVINAFPRRLIDGTLVRASDLDILLPAYGLAAEPTELDRIVVAGREKTIVAVTPNFMHSQIVQYRVQAR